MVHVVGRALLLHSPTHTHTVRQTTEGVGTWVALGHRGWPENQCTMGLEEMVIVWTGLQSACGNFGGWWTVLVRTGVSSNGGRWSGGASNDIAVVLLLL